MSINHFSADLQETFKYWWLQPQQSVMEPNPNNTSSSKPHFSSPNASWPPYLYHHYHPHSWPYRPQEHSSMFPPQNPTLNFNLNEEDNDHEEQDQEPQQKQEDAAQQQVVVPDKEPMFEKPLTPSDVGKLNRLVIPKQHAEKYFPLSGESVDKGLLLSFEDESGKWWRFRYSYWNSSQSYVLTKGWSRYVKEKQLDAGDVVLFERHRMDADRLFIGWRRRRGEMSSGGSGSNSGMMAQTSSEGVWSRGLYSSSSSSSGPYHNIQHGLGANVTTINVPYQPDCPHAGSSAHNQTTTQLASSRTVRLFGVNLECQLDESEPSTPYGSSLCSLQQGPVVHHQFYSQSAYSPDSHNQMDMAFSEDVNQTRDRRG